ncbi:Tat (twin-arginine translocation) pathway signal sequence [Salegentibacter holothuriorum]|uniref:Tat (Twin-arginine translocation) pathway signal sequence n=1 Tax=Salegentibacter holothuriorum TaxID=241145 RepID=A0A1T5CSV8_9FLAO|nr:Gfo/Idh/MocA family oxidoreductase [Salegentibacter holothuriorum]SKB62423.1 Tat (twin-arginine translocation) pathway signal sequence [Salegentibacter holothuriorum]
MIKKDRRSFIKNLGIAGATAAILPSTFAAETQNVSILKRKMAKANNKTLKIALIGAGGMGVADTNTALEHDNIELVAVCDLYDGRLEDAKQRWGSSLFLTKDYKDVLKRSDIDAVIIGTPDFWHKKISVDALNADKHVYCEKPLIHNIDEGQDIIKAWKKSGKIFMVGSQGMSSLGNEKAKELLAAGAIGTLNYAEGFWARNSALGAWQYPIPNDASTQTVDWEKYISISEDKPFDPLKFFRWRNYLDYGTGMAGDLFVHLFSSLHFITNSYGPNKIAASGGLRHWNDGREVPDVLLGMFDYPDSQQHPAFNLSLRCNFVDGTSGSTYLKLVGSKGSMDVEWDRVTLKRNAGGNSDDPFLAEKAKNESSRPNRKKMLPPLTTVYDAQDGYKGAHYDHFANFFTAIRENGSVAEDPVFGFRAAAPALLCNESYKKNEFINWDPEKMKLG